MSQQIAVRIPEEDLSALDRAIAAGEFENRAAAVRAGLQALLREARERKIAEEYRIAYEAHPSEAGIGEAGADLAAALIESDEAASSS